MIRKIQSSFPLISFLLGAFLAVFQTVVIAQDGAWHPDVTVRPRALMLPDQRDEIVQRITRDQFWRQLYTDVLRNAFTESADRNRQAAIAKDAAFCVYIGIGDANGNLLLMTKETKTALIRKALDYLRNMDPVIGSPSTVYQWKAAQFAQLAQAYDCLLGTGVQPQPDIETRLADFAENAVKELENFFVIKNNLSMKLASALGLVAVTLNTYRGDVPQRQPSTWAAVSLRFIDDVMWNYQSSDKALAGYSESPYYFRYAMISALPYFLALKNFNGNWIESYDGVSIQNPWFDTRYRLLYDWAALIKLPDGRLPAIDDSYMNSYFPELGIMATLPGSPGYYAWKMQTNRNFLGSSTVSTLLAGAYDFRPEYIATGVKPEGGDPPFPSTVFLPEAGGAVFRDSWRGDATYLYLNGKNGRTRTHKSPVGGGHKQANETAFILARGGELLAIEPGYYAYDQRDSLIYSSNHNIILVDGKGPDSVSFGSFLFGVDAFIEDTLSSEYFDKAAVRTSYQGADITRSVLFARKAFFVIDDHVRASDVRTFTHQVHGNGLVANGTCKVNTTLRQATWTPGRSSLVAAVTATGQTGDLTYEAVTRKHAPSYRKYAEHTALYTNARGSDVHFLSVLYPYGETAPRIIPIRTPFPSAMFFVEKDDWTGVVMRQVNRHSRTINTSEFSLKTDAAFLYFDQSRTTRDYALAIVDGTELYFNGRPFLKMAIPGDCYIYGNEKKLNGEIRAKDLSEVQLNLDYEPFSVTGDGFARWHMEGPRLILTTSDSVIRFTINYSTTPTGIAASRQVPAEAELAPPHPNPAAAGETIVVRYSLARNEPLSLDVINTLGRVVKTLYSGTSIAGDHSSVLNPDNLPPGTYFIRLATPGFTVVKPFVRLR